MEEFLNASLWIKVFFSVICGSLIGVERQLRGKPVGIRTSILICMSTMFFIFLALDLDGTNSASRVLGQLVTGVGFLGAGVIMTKGDIVAGVTSASIVWLLAGVGAAIGLGHYGMAFLMCITALAVLTWVQWLEKISTVFRRGVYEKVFFRNKK